MLDMGCVSTMSGAMRLGRATLTRLRLNFVNKPISERCVPLLMSKASFMNNYLILHIAVKMRLYHGLFKTPITSTFVVYFTFLFQISIVVAPSLKLSMLGS